ncbi:MAG: hypothetical protein P4L56_06390, partial [Candidatus Sulfopaludibacter sp.]|nr:hypothetical protein [Candidatus Sulfopaludibacter sp.]
LLSVVAASAQISMDPIEGPRAVAAETVFQRAATALVMKCGFRPIAPALNFSLQHDAGYSLTFPMDPIYGPSHGLSLLLRLQPEAANGKPLYLASRYDLPGSGDSGAEATLRARFGLSAGRWRVETLAIDDDGKACGADWRAEVKADPTPVATKPQQRLHRLTIFVDSQPIHITPGLFPPSDLAMLTGSLAALLRFIPAESARLVIFNMSQQKESFRSDSFQPAALPEVGKTIEGTQSGTIDYGSLQPQMTAEFVAGLVNRELREPDPADAVVFLGAAGQDRYRIPRGMIVTGASHPLFFYLQLGLPRRSDGPHTLGYTPPLGSTFPMPGSRRNCGAPESGGPCMGGPPPPPPGPSLRLSSAPIGDTISDSVAVLGGQTIAVSTPVELVKALEKVRSDCFSSHARQR